MHMTVVTRYRITKSTALAAWACNFSDSPISFTEAIALRVIVGRAADHHSPIHHDEALIGFLFGIGLAHYFKQGTRPSLATVDVLGDARHSPLLNTLLPFDILNPGFASLVLGAIEMATRSQC
jgi:hypothetical protein